MKIELKGIKYSAFASEATHCYAANLYVNGSNVARVSNDGNGGADLQDIHMYNLSNARIDKNKKLMTKAKNYIAEEIDREGKPYGLSQTIDANYYSSALESWCADQVADHVMLKELKRACKKNILFIEDGNLRQVAYKRGNKKIPVTKKLLDNFQREKGFPVLNSMTDLELLEVIQ